MELEFDEDVPLQEGRGTNCLHYSPVSHRVY